MRKVASFLVLILVAYIAGAVRHFGTGEVLAFVAPVVPHVTAFGAEIWSVVSPLMAVLSFQGEFVESMCIFAYLIVCAIWAIVAATEMHGRPSTPFPIAVMCLWDKRPTRVGLLGAPSRRTFPLWMAVLMLPAAVFEFGARIVYFVCFTVVTLFMAPFAIDLDMRRFLPSRKRPLAAEERALSTHKCEVVRVLLEEHTNADCLSIVKVHGYECVVRTKEWNDGDLAVCIPPGSVVPNTERFKFLGDDKRISVKNIRGRDSHGLLIPAPKNAQEGDDCMEALGVRERRI